MKMSNKRYILYKTGLKPSTVRVSDYSISTLLQLLISFQKSYLNLYYIICDISKEISKIWNFGGHF